MDYLNLSKYCPLINKWFVVFEEMGIPAEIADRIFKWAKLKTQAQKFMNEIKPFRVHYAGNDIEYFDCEGEKQDKRINSFLLSRIRNRPCPKKVCQEIYDSIGNPQSWSSERDYIISAMSYSLQKFINRKSFIYLERLCRYGEVVPELEKMLFQNIYLCEDGSIPNWDTERASAEGYLKSIGLMCKQYDPPYKKEMCENTLPKLRRFYSMIHKVFELEYEIESKLKLFILNWVRYKKSLCYSEQCGYKWGRVNGYEIQTNKILLETFFLRKGEGVNSDMGSSQYNNLVDLPYLKPKYRMWNDAKEDNSPYAKAKYMSSRVFRGLKIAVGKSDIDINFNKDILIDTIKYRFGAETGNGAITDFTILDKLTTGELWLLIRKNGCLVSSLKKHRISSCKKAMKGVKMTNEKTKWFMNHYYLDLNTVERINNSTDTKTKYLKKVCNSVCGIIRMKLKDAEKSEKEDIVEDLTNLLLLDIHTIAEDNDDFAVIKTMIKKKFKIL